MSDLYPFAGQFFDAGGGTRMHYLDEGRGPPVVMLHGNPTWSFYYRDLILRLRGRFRCVAPDHVGCGLSDKPAEADYPYSLKRRVDDLETLLDHLGVGKNITLVVHDWGGMIGFAYAARHPDRVSKIVVTNTAAFHRPAGKKLPWQLRLARGPLGEFLIRRWNWFCTGAADRCVVRRPLPPDVRAMYLKPYDTWANRVAVWKFVQTIPLKPGDADYELVSEVEANLMKLRDKPMFIGWGMRDFVFDGDYLEEWKRRFPNAAVNAYPDAGHYLFEDAGGEVFPLIEKFVADG